MEYEKIFKRGENYKQDWNRAKAIFTDGNEHLMILGKPVMERWETPLMYKLAEIVTSRGEEFWKWASVYLYQPRVYNHSILMNTS